MNLQRFMNVYFTSQLFSVLCVANALYIWVSINRVAPFFILLTNHIDNLVVLPYITGERLCRRPSC